MHEIWLLRHQESETSKHDIYTSFSEVDLTERGKQDAQKFADVYQEVKFDKIYSSPRKRALDSIRPLTGSNYMRVVMDVRLVEMNHGDWEGRTKQELNTSRDVRTQGYPNGETFHDVASRITRFIADMAHQDILDPVREDLPEKKILVVSHKSTCRIFTALMMNTPIRSIREDYDYDVGGLSIFKFENGDPTYKQEKDSIRLKTYNNCSYKGIR